MRNAAKILILALGAATLAACNKAEQESGNQDNIAMEANLVNGQLPPNAEIETLPPDESSEVTSGELNAGTDNADVNDLGNGH